MRNIILAIDGMTCSACSNGLEKFLNKQNGIISADVNLVLANANIVYDEDLLDIAQIESFVDKAGFKSMGEFCGFEGKNDSKSEKTTFIIFTVLALLVVILPMGRMILGFRLGIYEALPALCFLAYGKDILKNGWKNLIHKTPNMDTLIGIGVIASFGYSLFNLWKGNIEHLYFESSAIIIYFVKLGRYIDGINKEKTKSAIQKLVTITPALAVLKKDDVEQRITIDEIKKGDIVIARPGDKVAVDGEIVIGNAHFDESFISGESVPVVRSVGDKVLAGSLNYDGYIEYKAEKIGKNSMVSEIVKLVAKATATKTPMTKIADKISGYFVPMVIIIAFLTLGLNLLLQQGVNTAFVSFVCVLVVACPCALGLATPLAVVAAEGLCLKKGILVKSSELFETAAKVNVAVFDKTGTLTYGRLRVAKITNLSSETDDFVMQLAGSLESMSNHPVSRAFAEYMAVHKLDKLKIKSFENFDGMGVKGKVNEKNVVVGNAKLLKTLKISDNPQKTTADMGAVIYIAIDGKVAATIEVCDVLRESAKSATENLRAQRIKNIMLTGDNVNTAHIVAKEIAIDEIVADILPSGKLKFIKKMRQNGNIVMMCGDGINDSPALIESNVGVSINGGTDIAIDSAGIILKNENLENLPYFIKISKRAVKIIKQNLFWAMFYNILMIPIAAGVLRSWGVTINPIMASLAMVLSSTTVILNTLRLR